MHRREPIDTFILDKYIEEGRLIRKAWISTDTQGRETACLLAALAPEVLRTRDPIDCPAHIMPSWLAYLTPWIDDSGSEQLWHAVIKRYAAIAGRWHMLDHVAWRNAEYAIRFAIVKHCLHLALDTTLIKQALRMLDTGEPILSDSDETILMRHRLTTAMSDMHECYLRSPDFSSSQQRSLLRVTRSALDVSNPGSVTDMAADVVGLLGDYAADNGKGRHPYALYTAAKLVAADNIIDIILTNIEDACDKAEQETQQ